MKTLRRRKITMSRGSLSEKRPKVLVDLRPAFEGYGGIPQETRLLFSAISKISDYESMGLLTHPGLFLSHGTRPIKDENLPSFKKLNKFSRFVLSTKIGRQSILDRVLRVRNESSYLKKLFINSIIPIYREKITEFYPELFEDFIWSLFSKTLTVDEFSHVVKLKYRILPLPWYFLNRASLKFFWNKPTYLRLNTSEFDILLAQEIFPFKISKNTKLVLRFHDAIPFFYPHLISSDASFHRAKTYYGILGANKQNAYFVCVSEQVKKEVLSIIPQAEDRVLVIYDIVAPIFYEKIFNIDNHLEVLSVIVSSKINKDLTPKFFTNREMVNFYEKHTKNLSKYLLIVSSIEPRKNHLRVLSALENLFVRDSDLKLIVVGNLGPDSQQITSRFTYWIEKGRVFFLNNVPIPQLKTLYQYAYATICPSLAEGFDYSGIEAMAVGCPVIASDIPVHREVYQDGCLYFNPYSTKQLINAILSLDMNPNIRHELIEKGKKVAENYKQENIIPVWDTTIKKILRRK